MHTKQIFIISYFILWPWASARSYVVPANVRDFYNGLVRNKTCTKKLSSGYYSTEKSKNTFSYCGDHQADYNVVYLQGSNGLLADMDIACDGIIQRGPENDGRCNNDRSRSSQTAFRKTIRQYRKGIADLDPYIHSYAVFGNDGSEGGGLTFDPTDLGIEPLSVMAIVCNDKLASQCIISDLIEQFYGIWGDIYAQDEEGDRPLIGEASISLATECFGHSMNGNYGHEKSDVLYIAFPGKDAVPGADGADWGAKTWMDFHESITTHGDRLIQRIPAASNWSRPDLHNMHSNE